VRVDEVDIEPLGQASDRRTEARPAQTRDAGQRLQGRDVVELQALALGRCRVPAVADDVHLVAELGQPPTPADDVERAQIGDPEEA